jgi:signal transduction histidine kinase/ActR/RegA family two-component response regulator
MNPAIALSLVAAVVGALVALLSLRFGSAPGWRQYRTFAWVAGSAAVYCACDSFMTSGISRGALIALTHAENAAAAIHCVAWVAYVKGRLGVAPNAWHATLRNTALVLAVLWLLPLRGLMLTGEVTEFTVSWLGGIRYAQAPATAFGSISFLLLIATLVLAMVLYKRGGTLRGVRDVRLHLIAMGAILVAAVNDALVASDVLHTPLLLSLAFIGAVGAMGAAFTNDFVASARELDRLSAELETRITKRTGELFTAESALLRAEKQAAVGRLAAGVAHEINNPAGALAANLAYLSEGLVRGKLPTDARECLAESEEAVARIAKIVSQLLDTGLEPTNAADSGRSVLLLPVVETALAMANARIGSHVTTAVDVAATLAVQADESLLAQVLVNLVVNAAQAIPKGHAGRIVLRATKDRDRVRLSIEDNGTGMSLETERRMFEPFFTTKPHGEGTGLGLSVSLGIVRSMRGELKVLTSTAGTSVEVILAAGELLPAQRAAKTAPLADIRSVLVVDDDVAVARAVRRLLGSKMSVEVAETVGLALSKLFEQPYDLILSDLQMPGGGGRRLYEELLAVSPETARRVIFFSGGSPSAADAELIVQHKIPFLPKPLVVNDLLAMACRVAGAAEAAAE